MAYSKKAEALRRCTYRFCEGHERAGERCKAYALWESDWREGNGLCAAHAGHTRGPDRPKGELPVHHRAVPKCHCEAYQWPHRPGGGVCRWPAPPVYRCTVEAGTHGRFRRRGFNYFPFPVERHPAEATVADVMLME